ncbi:MAG: hypothetical protein F2566_03650 [Actinobacteria bacterium]|nr:hypothetical protein [Actinomycetota bacterium]
MKLFELVLVTQPKLVLVLVTQPKLVLVLVTQSKLVLVLVTQSKLVLVRGEVILVFQQYHIEMKGLWSNHFQRLLVEIREKVE